MVRPCADEGLFRGALALISDAHRAAALSHPRWLDIAQEPDPARQLVWMVRQNLLSYDELDDLQRFDKEPSDVDRIVEEAFDELGRQNAIAGWPA